MRSGYRQDLTLDRMRKTGPYSPQNCRWLTIKQQAYNRSTNRYLTLDGHRKTMQEWSDIYGVPKYTICKRLKAGWSEEDAVRVPTGGRRPIREEKEQGDRVPLWFQDSSAMPMIFPCWMKESILVSPRMVMTLASCSILVIAGLLTLYTWMGVSMLNQM